MPTTPLTPRGLETIAVNPHRNFRVIAVVVRGRAARKVVCRHLFSDAGAGISRGRTRKQA
jgi:hypothetical protein